MPTSGGSEPPQGSSAAEFVALVRKRIENLRPKLLDLTRRNPLLSAPISLRSNALIRAVDELPEHIFAKLLEGTTLRIQALPPLEADPKDEQTRAFQDALQNAHLTDPEYLEALDNASDGSDASSEVLARAERELKDRLRAHFKLPLRQIAGNPSLVQHARNHNIEPSFDLPSKPNEDGRHDDDSLQTLLIPDVLARRADGLMAKQRTWEQETGINVLQMAFGFLAWSETGSDQKNLAPLLLMPVKLEKKKTLKGPQFYVTPLGEATESNRVLYEKCASEFDLKLPSYADDPIEAYLEKIAKALPASLPWRVHRQVAVGVFPSARLAMYYDLDTATGVFDQHKITHELLTGHDVDPMAAPFAPDYDVDKIEIEKKVPYLVLSADSSQFSTLVDVADDKNVAVEGPPGTGKSQTIVNAIAAAMARGERVLFVAEKTAALDVVRSRLEAVRLGEFLLPLLANRSSKEMVFEAIKRRLEMSVDPPADYERKVAALHNRKARLAEYVDLMASMFRNTGMTVHAILGRAIHTEPTFRGLSITLQRLPIELGKMVDREWLNDAREKSTEVEISWAKTLETSPHWKAMTVADLDPFQVEVTIEAAVVAADAAEDLAGRRSRLLAFGIHPTLGIDALEHLLVAVESIDDWSQADVAALRGMSDAQSLDKIKVFLAESRVANSVVAQLSSLLDEPLDPQWITKLPRLVALAEEVGLESVSEIALQQKLAKADADLRATAAVADSFKTFVARFPQSARWPRSTLKELARLAHTTASEVFSRRNHRLLDAAALSVLSKAIFDIEQLQRDKARLDQTFVFHQMPATSLVFDHLSRFKNASFFSTFSSRYREARHFCVAISRERKFKRASAIESLTLLAEWTVRREKLASNKELMELCGGHFDGQDIDLTSLRQLHDFYRDVTTRLSPLDDREQIDLLQSASYHELRLLPKHDAEVHTETRFATIGEAVDSVEVLQAALLSLNAKLEELAVLSRQLKNRNECSAKTLAEICSTLPKVQAKCHALDEDAFARGVLGGLFKGRETHAQPRIAENIGIAGTLAEMPAALREVVIAAFEAGTFTDLKDTLTSILEGQKLVAACLQKLKELTGVEFAVSATETDWLAIERKLREAANDKAGLFAYAHLRGRLELLKDHPLHSIANVLLAEGTGLSTLGVVSDALFARALARNVYIDYGLPLSRWRGPELRATRSEIGKLDKEIISATQAHLRAKIKAGARVPAGIGRGPKSTWTEYALVNNELEKKKKRIAIRELTHRSGRTLQQLMPCWMMSPLAVAQYVQNNITFDLVVIDEASQMTPEDALGAIRRGKQVMIVGDTNQLPPTSFFKKLLDQEDEDEDEVVVEESILDLANAAFRPKRRLRWHYRSRDSGLIAFSNEYVYDRSLVFFPSPSEGRANMGVRFVQVAGSYANGTNPKEARAMVDRALHFMKQFPDKSLGLVTMNQRQQELIVVEMEDALSRDAKAAAYVADWTTRNDGLEYFFIKNLENVQGDERDAIFIGTVYGPAAPGEKVAQRFGPVNGVAGKRRLNVLFTRAKELIVTFSSMMADDIREEGRNLGVSLLKKWLEYSASGLLRPNFNTGREPDSDFELHVMEQLHSIGCEPVPQVGVEGYFIDIGVRHPQWPHGMLMGIECDGATYHSSKSARDRDRLRQEVLEGLGWHLYRIWSTDWFNDSRAETAKLKAAVEARLEQLKGSIVDLPRELFTHGTTAEPEVKTASVPGAAPAAPKSQIALSFGSTGVEVGDCVTIKYLDSAKQVLVVTLSDERNDPTHGVVATWEPLGDALLDAEEGDEVEFEVASQMRRVRVEKIEKGTLSPWRTS